MKRSSTGRELTREEVGYLRHTSASITYLQHCPKALHTNSGIRYERYKGATTYESFLALGGTLADFKYDYARSYVTLDAGEAAALEGFYEWAGSSSSSDSSAKVPRPPKPAKPAATADGASATPLPEQPPRKRLRSVPPAKPLASGAPPFAGHVSPLARPLLQLTGPQVTAGQLRAACVEPSQPALLRGVASAAALACCASVGALRAALGPEALARDVEVAVAPRGGTFFGDDLRREVPSFSFA